MCSLYYDSIWHSSPYGTGLLLVSCTTRSIINTATYHGKAYKLDGGFKSTHSRFSIIVDFKPLPEIIHVIAILFNSFFHQCQPHLIYNHFFSKNGTNYHNVTWTSLTMRHSPTNYNRT